MNVWSRKMLRVKLIRRSFKKRQSLLIKCEIEKAVLKKRQSLSINIKELRKDPSKFKELNNHELQLAFYLSCEPTILLFLAHISMEGDSELKV